jgi:hypothetical protein
VNDKTWDITIRVRATTLSGWRPEHSDVEEWLDNGGTLELVAVESVKEATS